jgi:pimeloyl-ACP methyl ester carboxylesterase
MPCVTNGDVSLHYIVEGASGSAVVFLHGLAGHCGEWAGSSRGLAARHRTIRIDQRGHGNSSRHPSDLSRTAFAEDVAVVIRTAAIPTPVTVVGQSMGAHTALVFADRYPELVDHLIMVEGDVGGGGPATLDTVVSAISAWPESFGSYEEVRDFFGGDNPLGRSWADGYEQRNGRWWPRFDPKNVHDIMAPVLLAERWDIWDRLPMPVDLVLAEHSAIDAARIDRMTDVRPHTARHTIAGAHHDLHLDQPERWLALLIELTS